MNPFRQAHDWIAEQPQHATGTRILQFAIGFMVLFRMGTEAPFALYLWGPHGIGGGTLQYEFGPFLGRVLDAFFRTDLGTFAVIGIGIAGAFGLLTGTATRWSAIAALFTLTMTEQRLPGLPDGGDNIARLTLTYMIFMIPQGVKPRPRSLSIWVHNIAVLAVFTQLVLMYFTSGFMKAVGEKWHNGTAMYYITQVDWFSLPPTRTLFWNPYITTFSTYVPMLYQLWFPMAIFSPLKLPWLAVGVAFHVGIAVLMGLVTFSSVMIGLELFLITDREWVFLRGLAFDTLRAPFARFRGAPRYLVYIDGYCPHCRRVGRWIEAFDVLDRVRVVSFRDDNSHLDHDIPLEDLERRLHVVRLSDGTKVAGFEAFRLLAREIPPFWPSQPALALAAVTGRGGDLYDFIADRRIIHLDSRACGPECRIDGSRSTGDGS